MEVRGGYSERDEKSRRSLLTSDPGCPLESTRICFDCERSSGSWGDVIGNRNRLTSVGSVQFNLVKTSRLGVQEIFNSTLKKGCSKDAFV